MSDAAIVRLELDAYAKVILLAAVAALFLIWLQMRRRNSLSAAAAVGVMPLQPGKPQSRMGFTAKPFTTE